jgi:hypothetical protein
LNQAHKLRIWLYSLFTAVLGQKKRGIPELNLDMPLLPFGSPYWANLELLFGGLEENCVLKRGLIIDRA